MLPFRLHDFQPQFASGCRPFCDSKPFQIAHFCGLISTMSRAVEGVVRFCIQRRSPIVAVLASIVLPFGTTAAPAAVDVSKFDAAINAFKGRDAIAIVNTAIAERTPADGKLHQDPVLNAMFGRLVLLEGYADNAAVWLDQAPVTGLPAQLAAETTLDHAIALERTGERSRALATFQLAATMSSNETQRTRSLVGQARLLMVDRPEAARALLLPLAIGPLTPQRWEAKMWMSLASSLVNDRASASIFATQSWTDAIAASLNAAAPLQISVVRAGLAAAAGDTIGERTMILAANGLSLQATSELSERLPVCGDDGIGPDDFVTFGFASGPYIGWRIIPIATSRASVIVPFYDALSTAAPIKADGPSGTVFTVRCRSQVHPRYQRKSPGDPMLAWIVEHGVYPATASFDSADENLNAVADRIDTLTARFGSRSPLLIGPRWQMLELLDQRKRSGDPVQQGQIDELATAVGSGLRESGAPEWLAIAFEKRGEITAAFKLAADDPQRAANLIAPIARTQIMSMPFDLARSVVDGQMRSLKEQLPKAAANLMLELNRKVPKNLNERERQSWLLEVAAAQHDLGQERERRATLAAAGVPLKDCQSADPDISLLEQHYSYTDYPDDLNAGLQEGVTALEFELSTSGAVTRSRVIYSIPSGIFDELSRKGVASIRYSAPKRAGKPITCRGVVQPIVWRLEDQREQPLPSVTDVANDPTS